MVDEGLEATNLVESLAADSQGGAEAEAHSAFNHFGEEHTGLEVGGDAQGLKPRGERGVRAAAIKSGDQAGLRPRIGGTDTRRG